VLARNAEQAQVLICRSVRLRERRHAPAPDGHSTRYRYFPLRDPLGRRFGALDYLAATSVRPEVYPCREWLEHHAPSPV
jgi:hypothetical protein